MRRKLIFAFFLGWVALITSCESRISRKAKLPVSASGVEKAELQVITNIKGLTVEQENVRDRLLMDNKVGAIKHLYVISPESGAIILYSTVKGKVTSSGKRLTPRSVITLENYTSAFSGFPVKFGKETKYTNEVLQDDGTYGDSEPYIYWWDSRGVYHQHFMGDGQIVHVSDQTLRVNPNKIQINLETSK